MELSGLQIAELRPNDVDCAVGVAEPHTDLSAGKPRRKGRYVDPQRKEVDQVTPSVHVIVIAIGVGLPGDVDGARLRVGLVRVVVHPHAEHLAAHVGGKVALGSGGKRRQNRREREKKSCDTAANLPREIFMSDVVHVSAA